MTRSIQPFLMFQDGDAEAAMRFYVSLFADGAILELAHYAAGGGAAAGKVMRAVFSVGGQKVMCTDSPVPHGFGFTPSSSLFVECESEAELDRLASALADGGAVLMEPANHGFSRKFAWLSDRFGVSWQLNLD